MNYAKLWAAIGGAAGAGAATFLASIPLDGMPSWVTGLVVGLGSALAVWRGPANQPKPGPISYRDVPYAGDKA